MKKVFLLATAAFLFTGMAFAHQGDGKKCAKGKDCCKDMKECKMDMPKFAKKDAKTATAKPAAKPASTKA